MPPSTNFWDTLQRVAALLWPGDPVAQIVLICVLVIAAIGCGAIYRPVLGLLDQLARLEDTLHDCFDQETEILGRRSGIIEAFRASPLAYQWDDFQRRWESAVGELPAASPELSRAPVRLSDVLAEHPILAVGTQGFLLTAMPALLLGIGLLGALGTLGLIAQPIAQPVAGLGEPIAQTGAGLALLIQALPAAIWGLLLALASVLAGRSLVGRCDAESAALDRWVALAFGSISSSELECKTAREQRDLLEGIRRETALSANSSPSSTSAPWDDDSPLFGSDAQPIGDLSVESDPQAAAALEALERLAKTADLQSAATVDLVEAARTLSETAESLRASIDFLPPLTRDLKDAGAALAGGAAGAEAAERDRTQAARELRQMLADSVAEISAALEKLTSATSENVAASENPAAALHTHEPSASPYDDSPSASFGEPRPSPPAPPPLPLGSQQSDSVYAAGSRLAAAEASEPTARDEETAHDRPVSLASLLSRPPAADAPEADPRVGTVPEARSASRDEASETPREPDASEEADPDPDGDPTPRRKLFRRS